MNSLALKIDAMNYDIVEVDCKLDPIYGNISVSRELYGRKHAQFINLEWNNFQDIFNLMVNAKITLQPNFDEAFGDNLLINKDIDLCKFDDRKIRGSLVLKTIFKNLLSAMDFSFKCPFRGGKVYRIQNYTASELPNFPFPKVKALGQAQFKGTLSQNSKQLIDFAACKLIMNVNV